MCEFVAESVFLYGLSNEGVDRVHFFEPTGDGQLEVPWTLHVI